MNTNKSEKPTPKRLRDSRREGQVGRSRDVISAATLLGMIGTFSLGGVLIVTQFKQMLISSFEDGFDDFAVAFPRVLHSVGGAFVRTVFPVVGILALCSVAAAFFQVGCLFSLHPIRPDAKRLNPSEGLKKLFSIDNLVELIKSVLKVCIVSMVLWVIIKGSLPTLTKIPHGTPAGTGSALWILVKNLLWAVTLCFVAIASLDLVFQKQRFLHKLRMTGEEVRRERKSTEGDPEIRSRRRRLGRELVRETTKMEDRL